MNLKKIYYKIEMFNYGIFVTLFFDFVKKKSHQICFPLTRLMPKLDFGKKKLGAFTFCFALGAKVLLPLLRKKAA